MNPYMAAGGTYGAMGLMDFGFGAASGALGAHFQAKAANRQFDRQRWWTEFGPELQMKGLKKAGINPIMALSKGGAAGIGGAPGGAGGYAPFPQVRGPGMSPTGALAASKLKKEHAVLEQTAATGAAQEQAALAAARKANAEAATVEPVARRENDPLIESQRYWTQALGPLGAWTPAGRGAGFIATGARLGARFGPKAGPLLKSGLAKARAWNRGKQAAKAASRGRTRATATSDGSADAMLKRLRKYQGKSRTMKPPKFKKSVRAQTRKRERSR